MLAPAIQMSKWTSKFVNTISVNKIEIFKLDLLLNFFSKKNQKKILNFQKKILNFDLKMLYQNFLNFI